MNKLSLASEGNPAETIRQLVLENDTLKYEHKKAMGEATSRIKHLEDQNCALSSQLSKLRAEMERSRQTHENFGKRTAEELRELKIMLKARENDNYSKDVSLASLDREMANLIGRNNELEKELRQSHLTCQRLSQAFKQQQEEITTSQSLSEEVLELVEQYCYDNDAYLEQRTLMTQYQHQLQHQIEEIEQTNIKLLDRLTSCRGIEEELRLQNTQNNDFAGLNERMLEELQARLP